jgi:hypothetical protein
MFQNEFITIDKIQKNRSYVDFLFHLVVTTPTEKGTSFLPLKIHESCLSNCTLCFPFPLSSSCLNILQVLRIIAAID